MLASEFLVTNPDITQHFTGTLLRATALFFSQEPFELADGSKSYFYVDERVVTDPEMAWASAQGFGRALAEDFGLDNFDVVYGPAYAGVPIAVLVSQFLWQEFGVRKPYNFDYKEPKAHGRKAALVCGSVEGKRVAIVDDLATSSGTKKKNWTKIQEAGGIPVVTVIGVDRTPNPEVLGEYVDFTCGAPVIALTNLERIAREMGFDSWAACEAANIPQDHIIAEVPPRQSR